jgi:hypothetical protein
MSTALSTIERAKLENFETIIEDGLQTCFDVGRALLAIRDEKLYRLSHKTFEEYCGERWNLKRQRAYELISASEIEARLSEISDTKPKESHTAELKKLPPAEQPAAWQEAVEESNGKPTAKHVEAAVNKRLGKTAAVSLYVCPTCAQKFTDEVWHCEECGHHWPIEIESCSKCDEAGATDEHDEPQVASPGSEVDTRSTFDAIAEAQRVMVSVRRIVERWPEHLKHEAVHWIKEALKECA